MKETETTKSQKVAKRFLEGFILFVVFMIGFGVFTQDWHEVASELNIFLWVMSLYSLKYHPSADDIKELAAAFNENSAKKAARKAAKDKGGA